MKSTPRHAKERGQDRTFAPTAPMPHSPCPGGWCVSRRHQEQTYFAIFAVAGRLAQLVQSTSFTPRGSGVRVPHRPPRTKHKGPCNAGAFCCPNTNQARLRAGKGSKKPTRPKGGALCLFRECPPLLGPPTEPYEGGGPCDAQKRTKLTCSWRSQII